MQALVLGGENISELVIFYIFTRLYLQRIFRLYLVFLRVSAAPKKIDRRWGDSVGHVFGCRVGGLGGEISEQK